MYNFIIIVLCFITILLIRKHIKDRPIQLEIQPAEGSTRPPLSWIQKTASTVNAIVIVIPDNASRLEKFSIWGSIVVAFCAVVTLVLDHIDRIVFILRDMFT